MAKRSSMFTKTNKLSKASPVLSVHSLSIYNKPIYIHSHFYGAGVSIFTYIYNVFQNSLTKMDGDLVILESFQDGDDHYFNSI